MSRPKKADTAPLAEQTIDTSVASEETGAADVTPEVILSDVGAAQRPSLATNMEAPTYRRARFLPLVLGGAVASALGFAGGLYLAESSPQLLGIVGTPGVEQRLSDHDNRLTDLAGALASLPVAAADPAATEALRAELQADKASLVQLQKQQDASAAQIAAMTERLKTLASAPIGAGTVTAAQVASENEDAAKRIKVAEEEALRIQTEAEKVLRLAALQAAVGELQVAFESGAPLDAALATLSDAGMTIPAALASQAQGVPTAAALREGFAPAARDALVVSLAETAEGSLWDRMGTFLRGQTGARSLTPRAGADPDAVLSRAEAALDAGDLVAALSEIATLPEAGRTRMAEWTGLATRRQAAGAAIAAVAVEVSAQQ